jgi:formate hydrogenlyase subunit 3/multisubunit Na+/H+ antiporter MnhD subunit
MAMPQWGAACILAGLLAAYYGVGVGLTQRNPKAVLAYSSISQMGLMTVGLGLAIGWPQTVPTVIPAIAIYALHHALAKGALFLGVGIIGAAESGRAARRLAAGSMILAALALAGAPLTSGAVAKTALKLPLKSLADSWVSGLGLPLTLAAIGTTLLMARLVFIVTAGTPSHAKPKPGMWLSWMLTMLLTATAVWLLPAARSAASHTLQLISLWQGLWPVAVGMLPSAIVWTKAVNSRWSMQHTIPQGDILFAFSRLYDLILDSVAVTVQRTRQSVFIHLRKNQHRRLPMSMIPELVVRLEDRLRDWQTACLIFVLLTGCLFAWAIA